jgi:hypothetical protein
VVLELAVVEGVDESPNTRDKDGKVNVLECPFPDVDVELEGPSSLIVSSLFFSFSLSLSLSGFLRKGRASDGNRLNVDVDVDVVVVEGGVGAGDEVVAKTGVRFLPKGGVVISY